MHLLLAPYQTLYPNVYLHGIHYLKIITSEFLALENVFACTSITQEDTNFFYIVHVIDINNFVSFRRFCLFFLQQQTGM